MDVTPPTCFTLIDAFGIRAAAISASGLSENQWHFLLTPIFTIHYIPMSVELRDTTFAEYIHTAGKHVNIVLEQLTPPKKLKSQIVHAAILRVSLEILYCADDVQKLNQLNRKILSGSDRMSDSKVRSANVAITSTQLNIIKKYLPSARRLKDDSQRAYFIFFQRIGRAREIYNEAINSFISGCQEYVGKTVISTEIALENVWSLIYEYRICIKRMFIYLETLNESISSIINIRSKFEKILMGKESISNLITLDASEPFLQIDKVTFISNLNRK